MERLHQTAQLLKREAFSRTAGAVIVSLGGSGDIRPQAEIFSQQPSAIVRTSEEMQSPRQESPFLSYSEEIRNIDRLREEFDQELYIDTSNKLLSWDPVKSRNRYEQCQTDEEREDWLQNELFELTTTLRERYNSLENPMDLYIDTHGFLRNRMFPTDTLQAILERGVAYQASHGSKELEREKSEVMGIKKIQADFTNPTAEDGDTRLIFSPPGMVEGSPYTKKFVDRYTLKIDPITGERRIDAKRYSTVMSYADYQEAALVLDPTYFDGEEGPLDAILLGKPINVEGLGDIDGLLDQILTFDPEALRGYEFELLDKICEPIKPFLVRAVIDWDPVTISRILTTLFHVGDEAEALLKSGDMKSLQEMLAWSQSLSLREIEEEIEIRGYAQIETRQVGCGDSGSLTNSVGQFGIGESDQYGSLKFDCPSCFKTNMRSRGILIPHCQHCGADVSCDPEVEKKAKKKKGDEKIAQERQEKMSQTKKKGEKK